MAEPASGDTRAAAVYRSPDSIVTSWIGSTTRKCIEPLPLLPFPKPIKMPSWADIATLRATYPRLDLVSASVDYAYMTMLTTSQQKAEACDSRDVLVAHGIAAPIALFAFPNNNFTTTINTLVRSQCQYRLVREDGNSANTPTSVQNGFLIVYSINGAHCTDPALACSTLSTRFPYTPRSTLERSCIRRPGPGSCRSSTGWSAARNRPRGCGGTVSVQAASHYTFHTGGDSTELYCANYYYGAFANKTLRTSTRASL